MSIRTLPSALKTSLLNYDPFIPVHLIKFERPVPVSQYSGKIAKNPKDYIYLTDAEFPITYQDGTIPLGSSVASAGQVYYPSKILKIGTVNENIQAKASNLNITLDATALNPSITSSGIVLGNNINSSVIAQKALDAGFQEGDKVLIVNNDTDSEYYAIIESFKTSGIGFDPITSLTQPAVQAYSFTITLVSEDLKNITLDKEDETYASFVNREVYIYKAHINPVTREIIGGSTNGSGSYTSGPYLYFKGIISKASLSETLDSSTITWGITSHWGDFLKVQGRLTDDSSHRALKGDGVPDLEAVIRKEYATDLGFLHANSAINQVATYQEQETRFRVRDKTGPDWLTGSETVEYTVDVDKYINLALNPQTKLLPVVYGVRKIDSFPVFADTAAADSTTVFKVDALCEGRIAGLLDIYVDSTSLICLDENDANFRNPLGSNFVAEQVEYRCYGSAERGDTLSSYNANIGSLQFEESVVGEESGEIFTALQINESPYNDTEFEEEASGASSESGITHEQTHTLVENTTAFLTFHAGLPSQKADNTLVSTAQNNNFRVQNTYYDSKEAYWSTSHRLLDTAYIAGKYKLGVDKTSLPNLSYVVRGSAIECHNYDGSYRKSGEYTSTASHTDFGRNDLVHVKTVTNGNIQNNVRIVDIWSFIDEEGEIEYRIRLPIDIDFGTNKVFYIYPADDDSKKYYLEKSENSFDEEDVAGTALLLTNREDDLAAGTNKGQKYTLSSNNSDYPLDVQAQAFFDYFPDNSIILGVGYSGGNAADLLNDYASNYSGYSWDTNNSIIDNIGAVTDTDIQSIVFKNLLKLDSTQSYTSGIVGNKIQVTNVLSDGTTNIQERTITGFNSTYNTVMVDTPWDFNALPTQDYTYIIKSGGDKRVSINPAMQLLDYMTNKRYGKGLDFDEINLDSFKEAARQCDLQSDITVLVADGSIGSLAEDDIYELTNETAGTQWVGTVKSIESNKVSGFKQVTFTDCSGKLVRKWGANKWYSYSEGEYIYHNNTLWKVNSEVSEGPALNQGFVGTPSEDNDRVDLVSFFNISKVSGAGPASLALDISSSRVSASGNPVIKKHREGGKANNVQALGYSLYDSDDVKYWRYLGWDSNDQRNVTRHQFNQIVPTTSSIFNNINNMLNQFNGVLRYSGGKYELSVRGKKGSVDVAEQISKEDIIGSIRLEDGGLKESKNSVTASIYDPANKFETRSISFFNSEYLKQDRGIKKTGNLSLDSITNYFNARMQIKQYLDEARYGVTIQFKIGPRGLLLTAGSIIELTYPRFGYDAKAFRIQNLNFLSDGTVDIVAKEHQDKAYVIDEVDKVLSFEETVQVANGPLGFAIPSRPTNLQATSNKQGEIILSWLNSSDFSPFTHTVEIYRSTTNNFDNQNTTLIGTSTSNVFHDIISDGGGTISRHYWIRYVVNIKTNFGNTKRVTSAYYPNTNDSGFESGQGITGSGSAVDTPRLLRLTAPVQSFVYNIAGDAIDANYPSSTTITATAINVTGTKSHVWERNGDIIQNESEATLSYTPPSSYSDMPEVIRCTMTETIADTTITAVDEISITAAKLIENGTTNLQFVRDGYSVEATAGTFNFSASSTGTIDGTSDFNSTFTISKTVDDVVTNYLYDASENASTGTFKYGTTTNISPPNAVQSSISGSGGVGISAITGSFLSGTSTTMATMDIPIIDNGDGSTIAIFRFVLTKSLSGEDSVRKALVYAYRNSQSIPQGAAANPGAVTVSLTTGEITTDLSNSPWTTNLDDLNGYDPVYIIGASAVGTSATDTIASSEWSDPVRVFDQAHGVRILLSKGSFSYDDEGDLESGQGNCTATAFISDSNMPDGTVYYDWTVSQGNTNSTQNTTGSSYTFTPPSTHSSSPVTFSVRVRLGATDGPVLATDGQVLTLIKNGVSPDALTVDSYSTSDGTTTINFNNGQSVEITGATKGVQPLYASSANPTQWSDVSTTLGSETHVNFYEYQGAFSSLTDAQVTALTFTKIKGEDGDAEGVVPIYADDENGTNPSFSSTGKEYVNFYEWAGEEPTTIPDLSNETFVQFVGDDGDPGVNSATVFIYKRTSSNTETTKPAGNTTYRFVDHATDNTKKAGDVTFTTPNGWSATPPTGTNKYLWYRTATAIGTGDTDLIGAAEWSDAQILSINGNNGAPSNVAGPRGSITVVLEESDHNSLTHAIVEDFVEDGSNTFVDDSAQTIAGLVMAQTPDGYIRSGDKVTVTDTSHNLAGTRIYDATSATNNSNTVSASSFSSLVVETFPGSVIVDGTLDANKLISNTVISNNIKVNSSLQVQSSGKIFTTNKSSYGTNNAGFFLGYTGGQYKLDVGNNSNYIRWDGSTLEIKGDVEVNSIDADDVVVTNLTAYHIKGGINKFIVERYDDVATHAMYLHTPQDNSYPEAFQELAYPTELVELEDGTFRTFSRRIHAQISGYGMFFSADTYRFRLRMKSGNTPDWTKSTPASYTPTKWYTANAGGNIYYKWRVRVTGNVANKIATSSFIRNQNGKILGFASGIDDGGPQYVSSGDYTKFSVTWGTNYSSFSREPVASDFTGTLTGWDRKEDDGVIVAEVSHKFGANKKPQQWSIQGALEQEQDSLVEVLLEVERLQTAGDFVEPSSTQTDTNGLDDRLNDLVCYISEIR